MSNTQNKPTPHRHAKLIKAWADGAKIQMFNFRDKKWEDSDTPTWLGDKYRIKPEEPSNEPWKPKVGEKYFLFDVYKGEIRVTSFAWENDSVDDALYRNHNCFRTREEAEDAVLHVEAALKGVFSKGINVPTNVSGNVGSPEIDGKPLSDIEKEAIRKFRAGALFPEAESGTWRALSPGEDALVRAMRKAFDKHFLVITKRNNDLSCHSCCIASPRDIDEEIRNAIKRIQKEQEG